jgi:hypothetical protein
MKILSGFVERDHCVVFDHETPSRRGAETGWVGSGVVVLEALDGVR